MLRTKTSGGLGIVPIAELRQAPLLQVIHRYVMLTYAPKQQGGHAGPHA